MLHGLHVLICLQLLLVLVATMSVMDLVLPVIKHSPKDRHALIVAQLSPVSQATMSTQQYAPDAMLPTLTQSPAIQVLLSPVSVDSTLMGLPVPTVQLQMQKLSLVLLLLFILLVFLVLI